MCVNVDMGGGKVDSRNVVWDQARGVYRVLKSGMSVAVEV